VSSHFSSLAVCVTNSVRQHGKHKCVWLGAVVGLGVGVSVDVSLRLSVFMCMSVLLLNCNLSLSCLLSSSDYHTLRLRTAVI
jgi:hypothetical protein